MVKRDLGPDAAILHTRTFKRGGIFGFGSQTVVEVTATDDVRVQRRRRVQDVAARGRLGASQSQQLPGSAGDLIRRTYAAARFELGQDPPGAKGPTHQLIPPGPDRRSPLQPEGDGQSLLVDEMRTVRRLVQLMMNQQGLGPRFASADDASDGERAISDKLFEQYLFLLEQQVAQELAQQVIQQVQRRLDASQHDDEAVVRRAVIEVMAHYIPTDDAQGRLERSADGRPRTVALVGPTGVGKTTTIAKLAATFKLKQNKNIGLVTLDTYRIAAVDQLRTYASIIGVPLHVVTNPQELASAMRKCAGCDGVLVDTAGRGQRDDPKLQQLRSLIEVADPHEIHLVLSSTCSQPVLMDVVKRFSAIGADRIIFTKLDEAVSLGVLLNVARQVNKRLSYITTGQDVPHQIEPGCPARLAELVLEKGALC